MDRPIDPGFQRKQFLQRLWYSMLVLSVAAGLFWMVPEWVQPSISRNRIRTARVDRGPIEATISVNGTVVPEFEQVFSSPVNSRIVKILKRAGDSVKKGEPILELDVHASVLALDKLTQELALKRNHQTKARLELQERLNDLNSRWELKKLDWESLKSSTTQNRKLFEQGLVSEGVLRQAELLESKAYIELNQLSATKKNAEETNQTELDGLNLPIETLFKERQEAERQLELATTRASFDGILTWVPTEAGATVHQGDVIARIADLKTFRVDLTVSDIHSKQVRVGLPVKIKVNEDVMDGAVATILPTIQNGVMTLAVALEHKSSPLLRSNMRVDGVLIIHQKANAAQLPKGAFFNGEGPQDVFVVRGDRAVKTPIRVGISSFDRCEVVDGLMEGDEVIVSDMRDFLHLKEIRFK